MYFILGMTTILWRTLRSGGIISGAGREADLQEKRTETFSPPRGDFEKRTPRAPRMNDLATQVKTGDMLKKILQTQVTLEAGELIGISPGISSLLHEAIKLKHAYPTSGK